MMIRESLAHALPEPDFVQQAGELVTTVWRDWLTEKVVNALGLNERQRQALNTVKTERQLTNTRYQQITGAGRPTAKRDLEDMVNKGVLLLSGVGRGAIYRVPAKRLSIGSIGSSAEESGNGSEMAQMAHAQTARPQTKSLPRAAVSPEERDIKGTSATTRRKADKPDATKPASARKRAPKGQKGQSPGDDKGHQSGKRGIKT